MTHCLYRIGTHDVARCCIFRVSPHTLLEFPTALHFPRCLFRLWACTRVITKFSPSSLPFRGGRYSGHAVCWCGPLETLYTVCTVWWENWPIKVKFRYIWFSILLLGCKKRARCMPKKMQRDVFPPVLAQKLESWDCQFLLITKKLFLLSHFNKSIKSFVKTLGKRFSMINQIIDFTKQIKNFFAVMLKKSRKNCFNWNQ